MDTPVWRTNEKVQTSILCSVNLKCISLSHQFHLFRDKWSRLQRQIVAIDALHFKHRSEQYNMRKVIRELNKVCFLYLGRWWFFIIYYQFKLIWNRIFRFMWFYFCPWRRTVDLRNRRRTNQTSPQESGAVEPSTGTHNSKVNCNTEMLTFRVIYHWWVYEWELPRAL